MRRRGTERGHAGRTRIVVLNPTCVYGPAGPTYTELPAALARAGNLRVAAGRLDRRSAKHHGREKWLQHQHAAERLHHQHDLLRAAAEATVFLGERQAQ